MSTQDDTGCARAGARLRIRAHDLVVADVTAAMGMTPDAATEKGYLRYVLGEVVVQPIGVWTIVSRTEARSLERHITSVLDRVEGGCRRLRALERGQQLNFDIFCLWIGDRGHGGPRLSARTLGRISALQASLTLDVYDLNWGVPALTVDDVVRS